jgi:mRNA-degrading endonuclease YafQ of YafQ-DinJ toxin-antitoxin module
MDVRYHRKFLKRIKRMPAKVQAAFETRLCMFMDNPAHPQLHDHAVDRAYPGCRSINVMADYRAIYRAHEGFAEFIAIGSHAELY